MFDGNAAGPGIDDPQNLDPHGLNFRLRDSPLLMAELQYAYQLDRDAARYAQTRRLDAHRRVQ